jgi:hypothetical protein
MDDMAGREAWNLRLGELSGLGRRRNPASGETELLAVGDRGTDIAALPVGEAGRLPRDRRHRKVADRFEVRGLPEDLTRSDGQSDWEGVAGDAAGHIFVLRETGSTVLVVSPTFEYERSVALRWETSAEETLESLLLLSDGHLLSACQGRPLKLLEFAAPGEPPVGPSAVLPADQALQLPPGSELECVATWEIPTDRVRSANDLATYGDHLFLISSVSRAIARFRLPAPGSDALEPAGVRDLPKEVAAGRDEKAEGLLVDGRLGVLVGVDRGPGGRGAELYELGGAGTD